MLIELKAVVALLIALDSCEPRPPTAVVSFAELTRKRESSCSSEFSSAAKLAVRFSAVPKYS